MKLNMMVLRRLYSAISFVLYFICVLLIPVWWFIPIILIGKSEGYVLNMWLDHIYEVGRWGNFE